MIAIGSDHAGYELKELIKKYFDQEEISYKDCGTFNQQRVDSVDIAQLVCEGILTQECDKGVLICGTGIGMSISANKVPGIRAALVENIYSAKTSKEHNDSNVLCIGARVVGPSLAQEIIKSWLQADFDTKKRRLRRKNKIQALKKKYNRYD